jgi:hypothetical protein
MLRRGLLAVPVTLSLMLPAAAYAAEATNGYTQTPPPPGTTTPRTTPTPAKKAAPSKNVAPSINLGTPVTIKPSPPPKTLPFTGLDLRWIIAGGVLLLGMGFTVRLLQRRARSN